jgi:hypothetical protein
MRTTDLFNFNRSSKRLNESLHKTFGERINFESFDTPKLEDARNKLRTQIHTARTASGFNETVENEALTKAQFMHDAIVAELMDRQEHIVDTTQTEGFGSIEEEVAKIMKQFDERMNEIGGYGMPDEDKIVELLRQGDIEGALDYVYDSYADQDGGELRDMDGYIEDLEAEFQELSQGGDEDEGGETDDAYALSSAGFGSDEDYESIQTELSKNTLKSYQDKAGKDIVHTMTSGDHMTTDKSAKKVMNRMRGSEKADNKIYKKENESMQRTQGENMSNLREGEVQQASAIVTAKTMVDRISRWIEELSSMENDTLLQLGDSIRDEMGQEQAKGFISSVAPAIQQALENLKSTRETMATGVRQLTGEEQGAEMLGAEPGADMDMGGDEMGPAEPDAMNMGGEELGGDDEFAAAEPAAGMGDAGREQRESIDRSSNLLRVLAG